MILFEFFKMKLKIYLFSLLVFSSCYIEAQNGRAVYKKQMSSIKEEVTDMYMKKALKLLETQEYVLLFHKNLAHFKKVEALSTEKNPIVEAYAQSISGFNGDIYYDGINKTVIHKKDFSGKIFLIKKNDINWTLTKDTKKIDKFICYKATTVIDLNNSSGAHSLPVTAWYTPGIPLSYGPDGFGGLPGLILELEWNGIFSTLKRIEFLENESLAIELPIKGEVIEENEFDALVLKVLENRKKTD